MNAFRRNLLFIFVMAALLAGCHAEQTSAPCPDYRIDTPMAGLPDYLFEVWPYPESEVTLQCYEETLTEQPGTEAPGRGVGVSILVMEIDTSLTSKDPPFDDRVHLYIDDEPVTEESLMITSYPIQFAFVTAYGITPTPKGIQYGLSWVPELSPGLYEARIEIIRDNGELLEYEWSFTITDQ